MIHARVAGRSGSLLGARGAVAGSLCRGSIRGMKITSARPTNEGKHVDIEFGDKTAYRFHTEWIKDSNPSAVGSDYYRKSAQGLFEVTKYVVQDAEIAEDGSKLLVRFANGSTSPVMDEYVATWLHAFAPYVGQPLNESTKALAKGNPEGLKGTGSLLEDLHKERTPWFADLQIPAYEAEALENDYATQVDFIEKLISPGVAIVHGLGAPESLEDDKVGLPLEKLVTNVIGRLNQHPARSTRYGVMHTRSGAENHGADYDHSNPLSMHTDHSVYNGTPGYLQFMYQAQGHVRSRIADGFALSQYMRENHPEEYKLLTTVHITHSSRNNIYSKNGDYKTNANEGFCFELVHTHPVIQLDADGELEKVVQSETKRGVSALPFDTYEKFMAAYRLWTGLVEQKKFMCEFDWPEHSMVCFNNYRLVHGRATLPPNMERTMCFGYNMKTIVDNRYRFLRQTLAEKQNPLMNDKWLTRLPNQVLKTLVA